MEYAPTPPRAKRKDFLLRHKLIEKDFDVGPWVDHGPLAEAHRLYAQWRHTGKA